MPSVTPGQRLALRRLRDSADALANYGTMEAVKGHYDSPPILNAWFVDRGEGRRPTQSMDRYHFLKFVARRWLICIESAKNRPQAMRFRWRLTQAGRRACWQKKPSDGTSEEVAIKV